MNMFSRLFPMAGLRTGNDSNAFHKEVDVPVEFGDKRFTAQSFLDGTARLPLVVFLMWLLVPGGSTQRVRLLGYEFWDAQRPERTATDDIVYPRQPVPHAVIRRERRLAALLDRAKVGAYLRLGLLGYAAYVVAREPFSLLLALVVLHFVAAVGDLAMARVATARLIRDVQAVHGPVYAKAGTERFPFGRGVEVVDRERTAA